MKVLFLTNVPAPYRVDFFSELGKLVDLTVIYERDSASDRNKKWKSDAKKNYHEIYISSKKIGADNSISFDVIKHLKNNKYDHIIIGQYSTYTAMISIFYMKLHKIPFIINSDGGFINYQEKKIKFKLKRALISSANFWLSTGKHTDEYFVYYGADINKIYRYPFTSVRKKDILGKKTLKLKDKYKEELGLNKKYKMILAVGSFIERKGFDILIKASKHFDNDIFVYIVGGVPPKEYQELVEKNEILNVKFVDFMVKKKLLDYYKAADLFVFPSREDIWGLVVNEALANGVPVITSSNCGSGLELIENNYNGYIVKENEDYMEYSRKVNEYCANSSLLESLSKNSLESIGEYTIEKMAIKTFEILKKIKY